MDKENSLRTTSFTISNGQYNWLFEQAQNRLLNKSIIIREAIELLKKEYDNGKRKDGNE